MKPTTPQTRKAGLSDTGPLLYASKDGPFDICLRRIRRTVLRARRRFYLLRWSSQEVLREFRNFVRHSRMLLTTTRHWYTGSLGPDLGPAAGLETNGHPVSCTRTLGRIEDIQSFFESNPEATQKDADWLLVGWDMGAEWASRHPHECNPGSCKRYVVLAPYRASIPSQSSS